MATSAPAWANPIAIAWPIPLLAPVTRTTLLVKDKSIFITS
jgi:hypothetical protein